MPQLAQLGLSKVTSITLDYVTSYTDTDTRSIGVWTEASEGAGRSYEATCSAGIYRVMTSCYQVTSHTDTISTRAVLDSQIPACPFLEILVF
jgi:hypothetical protein